MKNPARIFVRPIGDGLVPMPDRVRNYLPKEGALVSLNAHWSRRLMKQEVEIVPDPGPELLESAATPEKSTPPATPAKGSRRRRTSGA